MGYVASLLAIVGKNGHRNYAEDLTTTMCDPGCDAYLVICKIGNVNNCLKIADNGVEGLFRTGGCQRCTISDNVSRTDLHAQIYTK